MDLYRAIKELQQEKSRLDGIIASLELLLDTGKSGDAIRDPIPGNRPGGKGRTAEARQAASERMRKYWEARRSKPDA